MTQIELAWGKKRRGGREREGGGEGERDRVLWWICVLLCVFDVKREAEMQNYVHTGVI